ncbi:helix-turn-helix domain-containing protein [Clostridium beijerinckii]|uniref:Transcriptional regulator with XRE-family HTH domain n=1 Tax=Clostridium beijerinckii TaxID=1520 RepID=A0AAE5H9N9_CLOBE|nr:helix-turn-helix transcriptional regulator [Clostridium beijerinckii]NSB16537.1 transcriptional regulator with XRE-family HTH domain [Clostridium beijerinckii]OOM29394.1 helix-turn-helix domain protein [Clostridium beijerinckii]
MNKTGTILKNLRLKKNMTLDQLAAEINETFDINITGSMLSKWETGKAAPIYDHLKRLASYYNVTTDFLLGFDQYENLISVDSSDSLNKTKTKIRYSKKSNKIKTLAKLFEDDRITLKDLLIFEDFIRVYISKKSKNLYR